MQMPMDAQGGAGKLGPLTPKAGRGQTVDAGGALKLVAELGPVLEAVAAHV